MRDNDLLATDILSFNEYEALDKTIVKDAELVLSDPEDIHSEAQVKVIYTSTIYKSIDYGEGYS